MGGALISKSWTREEAQPSSGLVVVTFSVDTLLPMKGKGLTLAIDFPHLLIRKVPLG